MGKKWIGEERIGLDRGNVKEDLDRLLWFSLSMRLIGKIKE